MRQEKPTALDGLPFRPLAESASPRERQAPQQRDQRPRENEKRGCHHHQELMLRHVRRKQRFTERMQRREQS